MTDEKMVAIFKTFDIDDGGDISHKEMHNAFTKWGMNISEEEITAVMTAHDQDGGNTIDFEEFKEMIRPKKRSTSIE
jgi:Ca2+-binding EF-hand superfamily protein